MAFPFVDSGTGAVSDCTVPPLPPQTKLALTAVTGPASPVEGRIRSIDEGSGLMKINVGSDAGLEKGHTLEVFRLKPLPKYLGQIRIISVTHKEAVGQAAGRLTGQLQVGDTVAARIQGQ